MTARAAIASADDRRVNALARLVLLLVAAALLAALLPRPAGAYPIDPEWSAPRTVYIPETGHTVDGLFLDVWREWGGALSWGNPITPEFTEDDGHIVQYYEYARFEYWPEGDANGNFVRFGDIGAELRPHALPRNSVKATGGKPAKGRNAARDAVAEVRAWLPMTDAAIEEMAETEPTYRFVDDTSHGVWGGFRAYWEATGEAAYLGNPISEEYVASGTSFQVFERGKLSWREGSDIVVEPIGAHLADRYGLERGPVNQGDIPTYTEELFIPPPAIPAAALAPAPPAGFQRAIVVSLGEQALWAYEGNAIVRSTYVSTGKEKFRTPPGTFFVNSKIPVQDMAGVLGGEYYDVPKVPDVMYFTDRGHAIHGAYWHNNFGNTMSHGCINLPLDFATWLYGWAEIGTVVHIVT